MRERKYLEIMALNILITLGQPGGILRTTFHIEIKHNTSCSYSHDKVGALKGLSLNLYSSFLESSLIAFSWSSLNWQQPKQIGNLSWSWSFVTTLSTVCFPVLYIENFPGENNNLELFLKSPFTNFSNNSSTRRKEKMRDFRFKSLTFPSDMRDERWDNNMMNT